MSGKLLDMILRLFMIQYGNRVADAEWVIKLNKQDASEKSIKKLLKLSILVNLLISYGYFLVKLHASSMNVRRNSNSIELLFWQLNN